ncbi:MAG: hypothetical protein IME92_01445 [Proteobacteria bacterium]|nr:hypothetical protein [Pseudomonadota bacterium]
MSKSATRIIAADARKFNRVAPVTIGNPDLVDYLVCDALPPKDIAEACESWATEITLAN